MRKTKIVCTIGPVTLKKEMLESLVRTGMNVARLNMSHGTHEEKAQTVKDIIEIRNTGPSDRNTHGHRGPKVDNWKIKDRIC
jgi:pyruvate kinase